MLDGWRRESWDHTAVLAATLINVNVEEQHRIEPIRVHPYRPQPPRAKPAMRLSVADLARIYQGAGKE